MSTRGLSLPLPNEQNMWDTIVVSQVMIYLAWGVAE
jgi:hypothetical protein